MLAQSVIITVTCKVCLISRHHSYSLSLFSCLYPQAYSFQTSFPVVISLISLLFIVEDYTLACQDVESIGVSAFIRSRLHQSTCTTLPSHPYLFSLSSYLLPSIHTHIVSSSHNISLLLSLLLSWNVWRYISSSDDCVLLNLVFI